MDYYIGMDIGGTNIRIRAEFSDGSRPEEFLAAGCTMNTSGYERARACYQKAAGDFLKRYQLRPEDCRGLCAAVSGVDTEEEAEACRSMFEEMGFAGGRIWIFNDCEILLTLTDQPALVAVAGTGSVVYGRGGDGRTVRSGGWSHIISDEGSAMYMGLRVLQAAGRHMDGSCSCPELFALFQSRCPAGTLNALDHYVNDHILDKPAIAGLAGILEPAAQKGDPQAARILEESVGALTELIENSYRKVCMNGPAPEILFLWGSVLMKNRAVSEGVRARMQAVHPGLRMEVPQQTAAETALRCARRRGQKNG